MAGEERENRGNKKTTKKETKVVLHLQLKTYPDFMESAATSASTCSSFGSQICVLELSSSISNDNSENLVVSSSDEPSEGTENWKVVVKSFYRESCHEIFKFCFFKPKSQSEKQIRGENPRFFELHFG